MHKIASKELIKKRAKLQQKKYRDKDNLFICEGFHLVEEALKKNIVLEIFADKEFAKKIDFENLFLVTKEQIKKLSTTTQPQAIVAICKKFEIESSDKKILFLNNISDPGNLGTLIRSALAFNFDKVIIQGVDLYNPKVIRSSQGAIFHINCTNINKPSLFLENKKNVYGAIVDKKAQEFDAINYPDSFVIVLGNEANGIDKKLYPYIETKIYIPINFESLNVACAGSIIMSYIFLKKS